MPKIYGIGEALLDVIFKNNQPVSATAGGSTLNAIVSLGRMKHHPLFISEIGDDRIGDLIDGFLLKNGVSDQYLIRRNGNRSPLALAFLNENNDAEYEIFKDYSVQSLTGKTPAFCENDIVLFGSFFSLNPSLRPQLVNHLKKARKNGATIIYDPNFRKHHSHKTDQLISIIEENFSFSNIVRGSDEDFKNIYGSGDIPEIVAEIQRFCPNVIITYNSQGLTLFTRTTQRSYPSLPIEPVSTIGAGDNFNAGLIHGLVTNCIPMADIDSLPVEMWDKIILPAISFASEVCCTLENYVPNDYIGKIDMQLNQLRNIIAEDEE